MEDTVMMMGREYLGPVGLLCIETTVRLHTVRKGQYADAYTIYLYVPNLSFRLNPINSTKPLV